MLRRCQSPSLVLSMLSSQEVDDLLYGEGNFNFLDEFNTQGSQFDNLSQNTNDLNFEHTQGTQGTQGTRDSSKSSRCLPDRSLVFRPRRVFEADMRGRNRRVHAQAV